MECLQVGGLTEGKTELLQEDLRLILERADCSSFDNFKLFWKTNNLSLIHHALLPKESKEAFYETIWEYLLGIIRQDPDSLKVLYVLYTIFATQTQPFQQIRLDPDTATQLYSLACYNQEAASILATMNQLEAFVYGVKLQPKPNYRQRRSKAKIDITPTRIKLPSIEFQAAEQLCKEYHHAKNELKHKILTNLELFESEEHPDNEIAELFRPTNLNCLELADMTLLYKVEAELDTIEAELKTMQGGQPTTRFSQ